MLEVALGSLLKTSVPGCACVGLRSRVVRRALIGVGPSLLLSTSGTDSDTGDNGSITNTRGGGDGCKGEEGGSGITVGGVDLGGDGCVLVSFAGDGKIISLPGSKGSSLSPFGSCGLSENAFRSGGSSRLTGGGGAGGFGGMTRLNFMIVGFWAVAVTLDAGLLVLVDDDAVGLVMLDVDADGVMAAT